MDITVDQFRRPNADKCDAPGCHNIPRSTHMALCEMHYGRVRNYGRLDRKLRKGDGVCVQCGTATENDRVTCSDRCATRLSRGMSEEPFTCPMCKQQRMARADALYCSPKCYGKAHNLEINYGLSVQQYLSMMETQEGRCAICQEEMGEKGHVDHCHGSGEVRGLLCHLCNPMLGYMRDNPEIARAAIRYLTSPTADVVQA